MKKQTTKKNVWKVNHPALIFQVIDLEYSKLRIFYTKDYQINICLQ